MGCINKNEIIQSKLDDSEQIKAHLLKETGTNKEKPSESQPSIHMNLKDEDTDKSNKTLFLAKPKETKVITPDNKENNDNLNENDISINTKPKIDYNWIINKEFEEDYNIIKITKKIKESNEQFLIQSKKDPSIFRLLNKVSKPEKPILEEIKTLKNINNKYIVKFHEIYKTNQNYYYVTDYCKGGSLYNKLQNNNFTSVTYSERQIKYLSYQLFQAIKYLNILKFIHGNINPSNILISEIAKNIYNEELYDVKLLLNFSSSSHKSKNSKKSPYYLSPDFINKNYDGTCDVWSVGVIMYQMFYNDLPFKGNTKEEIIYQIKNKNFSFPSNKSASPVFKSLLISIFCKNPKERITVDHCLNHPWYTSIDIYYNNSHNGSFSFAYFNEVSTLKNDLKQRCSSEIESDEKSFYNKCSNRSSLIFHNSNAMSNSRGSNELYQNNHDKQGSHCMNESIKTSFKSLHQFNSIGMKNMLNNKLKLNTSINLVNVNKTSNKNMENISNINKISNIEDSYRSNGQQFSELVTETIKFITYYIRIKYEIDKERAILNDIYLKVVSSIKKDDKNKNQEDNTNNTRKNKNDSMNGNTEPIILTWENLYSGILNYIQKKRLSLDFINANYTIIDSEKPNHKKNYSKEEFYDLLIKYKIFYLDDELKKTYNLLTNPNTEEFLSSFSDILKMPFNKFKVYFENIIKIMQMDRFKEIYNYEEYKELVMDVVDNIKIKEGKLNENNNNLFENFLGKYKQENCTKDLMDLGSHNLSNHLNLNSNMDISTANKELNNDENNNEKERQKEKKEKEKEKEKEDEKEKEKENEDEKIKNKNDGMNISAHAIECFNEIKDDELKEIKIHKMLDDDLCNNNKEEIMDNKENEDNKNDEFNINADFKYDPERFLSIIGVK